MGLLEKRRFQKFLIFCNDYDESDPKTHKGVVIDVVWIKSDKLNACYVILYPLAVLHWSPKSFFVEIENSSQLCASVFFLYHECFILVFRCESNDDHDGGVQEVRS